MSNGATILENNLAVLQKVKHRVIKRPRISTPLYIPQRNENIYSQKPGTNVHKCVPGCFINNNQKARTTQMSINGWKDTIISVAYPYNGILFSYKKEWWGTTTGMNLETIMPSENKTKQKEKQKQKQFIYLKCPQ